MKNKFWPFIQLLFGTLLVIGGIFATIAEENKLEILHGQTKEIVGSVSFEGATLNPWDIDVAVQGDIAVIYFGDSHQLFGFRLRNEASN